MRHRIRTGSGDRAGDDNLSNYEGNYAKPFEGVALSARTANGLLHGRNPMNAGAGGVSVGTRRREDVQEDYLRKAANLFKSLLPMGSAREPFGGKEEGRQSLEFDGKNLIKRFQKPD